MSSSRSNVRFRTIDADIVIIGGGIAGLTAAYCLHLKEPTINTIILESSARIGGRIFSIPLLVEQGKTVSYFDLGGQWISKDQVQLLDLLNTLGIQRETPNKQGKVIAHYKHLYMSKRNVKGNFPYLSSSELMQLSKFIVKVEILSNKLKGQHYPKHAQQLSEKTLEQFIKEIVTSDAVYAIIQHMVFVNCAVRPQQVSALFYIFFCVSSRGVTQQLPAADNSLYGFKIKGGAHTICEEILKRIGRDTVKTNEQVKSITHHRRYVEVDGSQNIYRCRCVIVTVPPKVLLDIKFSPQLPREHIDAIQKTVSNNVTSFVATFEREFWKSLNFTGDCYIFDKTNYGPIDYCQNVSSHGKPALSGRIFEGKITNDKLPIYRREVLRQLAHYFGAEGLQPIDYREMTWSGNSCQMIGWQIGNVDYIKHVSAPHDRVFFAGAETTPEWYGSIAGAVHSGTRAALEALYFIRPAVLNPSDLSVINPRTRRTQTPFEHIQPLPNSKLSWAVIISVGMLMLMALWKIKNIM